MERSAVLVGWTALGVAGLLAAWSVAPLARRGAPDLAALRPRVEEAVRAAGGSGGSTERPRRPSKPLAPPAARLDVNRATAAELTTLPGIGPVMAARIVEYRQSLGAFPRPEALRGVPGIGPKRFERIAPLVTAGLALHAAGPGAQRERSTGEAEAGRSDRGEP